MAHFITIAGPQSSGKSTAINYLKKKYPKWYYLETIDPYTIGGMEHSGAAYTDRDLQINLMKIELIKISAMKKKNKSMFIGELGIFRLVYAHYFYHKKLADEYFDPYIQAYDDYDSHIILIDTKPEISFKRRKNSYVERIRNRGIRDKKMFDRTLKKYQDTIFRLYPHWLRFYNKLRYPKTIIQNSYISEQEFLTEIDKVVNSIRTSE